MIPAGDQFSVRAKGDRSVPARATEGGRLLSGVLGV